MSPKNGSRRRRLSEGDWVRAGLEALADGGIEGVRIDALARRLGVTKGSFYWHFKNRDVLLEAVARAWTDTKLDSVIEEVYAAPGDPRTRLALFGILYERSNLPRYDRAMRAWALSDRRAAEAVKTANARVHEMMVGLYEQLGFDRAEAATRARVHILCGIGTLFAVEYHDIVLSEDERRELRERFMDLLTAPRRADSEARGAAAESALGVRYAAQP